MNDLISRQSATKLFENMVSDATSHGISPLRLSPDYVISGIEALPSAQQWIPCSERLPENDDVVLIYDGREIMTGYYVSKWNWGGLNNSRWYSKDLRYENNIDIIAWMPLPEPYKEK